MKKFKATNGYSTARIEACECRSETGAFVVDEHGRKRKKETEYESFFDSFEGAKTHLVKLAENELSSEKRKFDTATSKLNSAKGLKQ